MQRNAEVGLFTKPSILILRYLLSRVQVDDTIPKIDGQAKKVLAYVEEGDKLRTQLVGLKKLARYQPIDTVSRRRMIADRIID